MPTSSPNLRPASRWLLKSPVFTLLTVLMLALGIGASTAIFSLRSGVVLKPTPFPRAMVSAQQILPADRGDLSLQPEFDRRWRTRRGSREAKKHLTA